MSTAQHEHSGLFVVTAQPVEPDTPFDPAEAGLDPAGAEAAARVDGLLAKVASSLALAPVTSSRPATRTEPSSSPALGTAVGLRVGQPVAVRGRAVTVRYRGAEGDIRAELAPGVAPDLVAQCISSGNAVLLEALPNETPMVVGVLQTQMPEDLTFHARRVLLEADEEIVLRSGHGALRIRQDGEIELVGSRISALSRGLFRLVGRILRLN